METTETAFTFVSRTSKKQSFDKRLITHIIVLLGQGVPRKRIIAEYGVCSATLSRWLRGDNTSIVDRKSYTTAEKRSVVRAVESGLSIRQAQIAFNISSSSTVRRWMKDFEKENAELSDSKPREVAKKTAETSEDLELKALKKALEEANLKIRALDTMIDIAEEQLKIGIRKKSGARQSSK
jgi:transposase-like protein